VNKNMTVADLISALEEIRDAGGHNLPVVFEYGDDDNSGSFTVESIRSVREFNDEDRRDFALKISTQIQEQLAKYTTVTVVDIKSIQDLRKFLAQVIVGDNLGAGFHPDSDFHDYVHVSNGDKTYLPSEADHLNVTIGDAFDFCNTNGLDIYEIASDIWFHAGITEDDLNAGDHLTIKEFDVAFPIEADDSIDKWLATYKSRLPYDYLQIALKHVNGPGGGNPTIVVWGKAEEVAEFEKQYEDGVI